LGEVIKELVGEKSAKNGHNEQKKYSLTFKK
jgi:hypothetical protein